MRLPALLCESLLGDDRIQGALEARIKGLLGLPLEFEPGGDQGQTSVDVAETLRDGEDYWEIFRESEQAQIMCWAILLGFGVGVMPWGWHQSRYVPRVEFWHPQALRFDNTSQRWSTITASNATVPVDPGDGVWFMITPRGQNRPWSTGLWRALAPWWILKQYAMADWGAHAEKGSRLVATAPEGSTRQQRLDLAADLFAAAGNAVIALPAGYDLKLVEAVINGKLMYGSLVDAADDAITIAIRGNNLTTEVQGGSLAAADVHAKIDASFLRSDANNWSTASHDQVLTWWAKENFGDSDLAPWTRYDTTIPEDKKTLAETLNTLASALSQLVDAGVEVDIEALAERFDLGFLQPRKGTVPDEDDDAEAKVSDIDAIRAVISDLRERARSLQAQAPATDTAADRPGQEFADKLRDEMAQRGSAELGVFLASVIGAIRSAGSYEEAYAAVARAYESARSPVDMTQSTEAGLVLGELGGELEAREQYADAAE
jgi:phage gp29-like protein